MRVSARADYALRAVSELAAASGTLTREQIAERQDIPVDFLQHVLVELRHAGIVTSQRGSGGGFRLGRAANDIRLADVIRAVDGPMANVRGERPELVAYTGPAHHLRTVWIAVRASLRDILESTTLQDVIDGTLPAKVEALTRAPDAWVSRNRSRSPRGDRGTPSL